MIRLGLSMPTSWIINILSWNSCIKVLYKRRITLSLVQGNFDQMTLRHTAGNYRILFHSTPDLLVHLCIYSFKHLVSQNTFGFLCTSFCFCLLVIGLGTDHLKYWNLLLHSYKMEKSNSCVHGACKDKMKVRMDLIKLLIYGGHSIQSAFFHFYHLAI